MAGRQVHIRIPNETDRKTLDLLRELIGQCRGQDEVFLHVACEEGEKCVHLTGAYGIAYNQAFRDGVQGILGDGAVWVGAK